MKNAILIRARDLLHRIKPREIDPGCCCLLWGVATVKALQDHGHVAVLQAGSASWPVIPMTEDDGIQDTHFSYTFDPSIAAERVSEGMFPEMHVWAGLPKTQEIVDMTTGYQMGQCRKLTPYIKWDERVTPPPYFWGGREDLPRGWVYRCHPIATQLSLDLILQLRKI